MMKQYLLKTVCKSLLCGHGRPRKLTHVVRFVKTAMLSKAYYIESGCLPKLKTVLAKQ